MSDQERSTDIRDRNIEVTMVHPSLADTPRFPLPAGFGVKWYEPGDEQHWVDIHQKADRYNKATAELFRSEFGTDEALLRRRQCFLTADKDVIGTATAWCNIFQGQPFGQVHWVAIVPGWQGRGLARPLVSTVVGRMLELGHEQAFLVTQTPRMAAISLYSRFGFRPWAPGEEERHVWEEVGGFINLRPFLADMPEPLV